MLPDRVPRGYPARPDPARPRTDARCLPGRWVVARPYSHSIVAGGLELMSYTTRLTPGTSFTIRELIVPSTS